MVDEMLKHSDHITHIDNAEDVPYLRTPLFNVNMRLFKTSAFYRFVVLEACRLIVNLCATKMEGYKLPHGMSGANAGIPWNIIGIARNRGEKDAWTEIMINPKILAYGSKVVESQSNCGSLTLKEPITIKRHAKIDVEWHDTDGAAHKDTFDSTTGAFTIQHEVDHNLGVMITDRIRGESS